jgi:phosphotransferase system HPr (HPr) family protein
MDTLEATEVVVLDPAGLHARPAAAFAAAAGEFAADVTVSKNGATADGKSVLLLLMLDVRQGDQITITADGPDASAAVAALATLVGAA